jgi:hypothetical protein
MDLSFSGTIPSAASQASATSPATAVPADATNNLLDLSSPTSFAIPSQSGKYADLLDMDVPAQQQQQLHDLDDFLSADFSGPQTPAGP